MPFIPLWLDVCIAEGERSIVEMTKKGKKEKKIFIMLCRIKTDSTISYAIYSLHTHVCTHACICHHIQFINIPLSLHYMKISTAYSQD